MNKSKGTMFKGIGQLIMQLLMVAVGVYLGLLAGNWNDDRKHRANQVVFLENLVGELEENQFQMANSAAYHAELSQTVDSILSQTTAEDLEVRFTPNGGFDFIRGWRGIQSPFVSRSIYESGLIANLMSNMDFETISRISTVYTFQDEFKKLLDSVVDRMMSMTVATTRSEILLSLEILTSDIKGMEEQLGRTYTDLISFLKGEEEN